MSNTASNTGEIQSDVRSGLNEEDFVDFRNKGFKFISTNDSNFTDTGMTETPRKRSIESLRPPPRDMPLSFPALELKEITSVIGLYGIGMQINTEVPHAVRHVSDLRDENGNSLNDEIQIGDVLILVDDQPIHNLDVDALERALFGEKDSIVSLTLKSKQPGRVKQLRVKRHILIRTFETCQRCEDHRPASVWP